MDGNYAEADNHRKKNREGPGSGSESRCSTGYPINSEAAGECPFENTIR